MVRSPAKPWRTSSSAARTPVSEAPTTTTRSRAKAMSALDGDGLGGADAGGRFDLGPQFLARLLLKDVEVAVVADLEHLGRLGHAQGVALALVEVDHHAHLYLQESLLLETLAL